MNDQVTSTKEQVPSAGSERPPTVVTRSLAVNEACRLAEELRESDAAEYSREEVAVMALYYEVRRLQQGIGNLKSKIENLESRIPQPATGEARWLLE